MAHKRNQNRGKKNMNTTAQPPVPPQSPAQPEEGKFKDPHRGIREGFYLEPEVFAALKRYCDDHDKSRTRVWKRLLKTFLLEEGYWPGAELSPSGE